MEPQSLQIEEDIPLHHKGWKFQKVIWIFLCLFLLFSILGLFGNGILSKKTVSKSKVVLEYEYFLRKEWENKLKFKIKEQEGRTLINIPQTYLNQFYIDKISPDPENIEIQNSCAVYSFKGNGQMLINFFLVPKTTGSLKTSIFVGNEELKISHFIYP